MPLTSPRTREIGVSLRDPTPPPRWLPLTSSRSREIGVSLRDPTPPPRWLPLDAADVIEDPDAGRAQAERRKPDARRAERRRNST
ncbi:hypothetical protein FKM82_000698 [Ascaphus truei]